MNVARKQGVPGLSFIDAHAMAPFAVTPTEKNDGKHARFTRVQAGLPGQESVYEQAWHRLVRQQGGGYPNSAAFVTEVWKRDFSLLLCEIDGPTVAEIKEWLPENGQLFPGDWVTTFGKGLPTPSKLGLPTESLTLLSFDPDMYDRRRLEPPRPNKRHLYPGDLGLVRGALNDFEGGVLIQLSTYWRGTRDQNPQGAVVSSVNSILAGGGFTLAALVWANKETMSLVYARGIDWSAALADLPGRFDEWLARA